MSLRALAWNAATLIVPGSASFTKEDLRTEEVIGDRVMHIGAPLAATACRRN